MQETRVWSLGREDPLEKEMATHSSILVWEIPWTEERATVHGVAKSWTWLSNFTLPFTSCRGWDSGGSGPPRCSLSSCGPWAKLSLDMWELPGREIQPVSPASQGRFVTTGPAGKAKKTVFDVPKFLIISSTFYNLMKCGTGITQINKFLFQIL